MKTFKIITGIVTILIFSITTSYGNYIWSSGYDLTINTSTENLEENVDNKTNPLNLDCGSAILMECFVFV